MAVLKKTIDALDPTPDAESAITLALSLISELAEQKVKQYSTEIRASLRNAGTAEDPTVPISEVLEWRTDYRAYVQDNAQIIPTEVGNAVQKFFGGGSDQIISGIKELISTAIDAILGAAAATQEEKGLYLIEVQDAGIARYDFRLWSRQVRAKGLTERLQSVLVVVAFKSSVDVSKISLNSFLLLYNTQLAKLGLPPEQVKEYVTAATEVFVKLGGKVSASLDGDVEAEAVPERFLPGTVFPLGDD